MTLDEFIDKVCQRPLPQHPLAQVSTLAKELAEGASVGVWGTQISFIDFQPRGMDFDGFKLFVNINRNIWDNLLVFIELQYGQQAPQTDDIFDDTLTYDWLRDLSLKGFSVPHTPEIGTYLLQRGYSIQDIARLFSLALTQGYLDKENNLTAKALDLLQESEPSTIFISYKRSESSAFALLVLKYLKEARLEPFLDMALVPGEDWHDGLKERIQSRDYFILLLSKTTLESLPVVKEIEWAMEKGLDVIPIWQPGFDFKAEKWPTLSEAIKHKLANTHTIRVLEENPTSYHTAMVELLNKFGITP